MTRVGVLLVLLGVDYGDMVLVLMPMLLIWSREALLITLTLVKSRRMIDTSSDAVGISYIPWTGLKTGCIAASTTRGWL